MKPRNEVTLIDMGKRFIRRFSSQELTERTPAILDHEFKDFASMCSRGSMDLVMVSCKAYRKTASILPVTASPYGQFRP